HSMSAQLLASRTRVRLPLILCFRASSGRLVFTRRGNVMAQKHLNFTIGETGGDHSLPVLEGTMGPAAVDIQPLFNKHGLLTFDPGFRATASTKSAITFIDGDAGILLHRGYPIEELADHSHFIEV